MARQDVHQEPVEIVSAAVEQKSTLANLLELYSHDFSEFIDLDVGDDGRFGYRELDLYWSDPNRRPFLIYADRKLAGFLLVRCIHQGRETAWDMTEFFVIRGFRKRGVGRRAAIEMFTRFSGRWPSMLCTDSCCTRLCHSPRCTRYTIRNRWNWSGRRPGSASASF